MSPRVPKSRSSRAIPLARLERPKRTRLGCEQILSPRNSCPKSAKLGGLVSSLSNRLPSGRKLSPILPLSSESALYDNFVVDARAPVVLPRSRSVKASPMRLRAAWRFDMRSSNKRTSTSGPRPKVISPSDSSKQLYHDPTVLYCCTQRGPQPLDRNQRRERPRESRRYRGRQGTLTSRTSSRKRRHG